MMQIAICETSAFQRELFRALLEQIFQENKKKIELLEYDYAETLIANIEEVCVNLDLLFINTHLWQMNGMEAAHRLLDCNVPIIFLAETAQYAIEGYEVGAVGYLLMPFNRDELKSTLSRIMKSSGDNDRRIAFRSKRQNRYVKLDDITYIESDKHAIRVFLMDGSCINTTGKLDDIEAAINNECDFLCCNQSYLVNMNYIANLKEDFILSDGTIIPIRVRGRKTITDRYREFLQKSSPKVKDYYS